MLELVHPALQTDAVISAPKSGECDEDIHLYAQKFDAWLQYENYANRPYSPREQVNKFITELSPVFAPAVSRVRQLLDAWNPFDLTVPEVLKITALPNTIERFMMEETGQTQCYIRKLQDKRTQRQRFGKTTTDSKELVDKFCHFCGMHGHVTTSCEFMAKLLIANESLSKVDPKAKKESKTHSGKSSRSDESDIYRNIRR
jgi:hypothetical protein